MGFEIKEIQPKKDNERDLQKYYSQLYREVAENEKSEEYHVQQILTSLYCRTRVGTKTYTNRQLALLDIDKLISFNSASLKEQGDRVKYMRMVSGLMQQSERTAQGNPNMQIQHLVRLARLHYMSQHEEEASQ